MADLLGAADDLGALGKPSADRVAAWLRSWALGRRRPEAPDLSLRERNARRDDLLRELRERWRPYRVSVNEAATRMASDASRYFASAGFELAAIDGRVPHERRHRPEATFLKIAQLPAKFPSARTLRKILAETGSKRPTGSSRVHPTEATIDGDESIPDEEKRAFTDR